MKFFIFVAAITSISVRRMQTELSDKAAVNVCSARLPELCAQRLAQRLATHCTAYNLTPAKSALEGSLCIGAHSAIAEFTSDRDALCSAFEG